MVVFPLFMIGNLARMPRVQEDLNSSLFPHDILTTFNMPKSNPQKPKSRGSKSRGSTPRGRSSRRVSRPVPEESAQATQDQPTSVIDKQALRIEELREQLRRASITLTHDEKSALPSYHCFATEEYTGMVITIGKKTTELTLRDYTSIFSEAARRARSVQDEQRKSQNLWREESEGESMRPVLWHLGDVASHPAEPFVPSKVLDWRSEPDAIEYTQKVDSVLGDIVSKLVASSQTVEGIGFLDAFCTLTETEDENEDMPEISKLVHPTLRSDQPEADSTTGDPVVSDSGEAA